MRLGSLVQVTNDVNKRIGVVVVSLTGSKYASVWFPNVGVVSFLAKEELEVICK